MSKQAVIGVGLVILIALAGCASVTEFNATRATPDGGSATPTATVTQTATPTETPLGGEATNPWGKQVVTVTVRSESRANVQMGAVVKDAIGYWNGEGAEYTDYPVTFEYRQDAKNPDVAVIPVESINDCGIEGGGLTLGCAPILEKYDDADNFEIIRVVPGLTYKSTLEVVKHEFGHVVGKRHGDEPMPLMEARTNATRPPVPDATERDYSFRKSNVSIYSDGAISKDELERAVQYLNDPSNTPSPDNLNLEIASSKYDADIVVEEGECQNIDEGSCARYHGYDYDGRGEFDWYTNATITIDNLDEEVVAWHASHWTVKLLYGETFDPFHADEARSTRENWLVS